MGLVVLVVNVIVCSAGIVLVVLVVLMALMNPCSSCVPPGAAAAAAMSGPKTVLRPTTGTNSGQGQGNVPHIIHLDTIRVLCFDTPNRSSATLTQPIPI